MRTPLIMFSIVFLVLGIKLAAAADQPVKIDTLIQEPAQVGDLPEAVVEWLEIRDFLIPLPYEKWYRDQYGNSLEYGNTLVGSFTGVENKDCAVLTIPHGALEDSCRLWVFPAGDTLAPMLVGAHSLNFAFGSQWWPLHGMDSLLGFAWRISPLGSGHIEKVKNCGTFVEGTPEMAHDGIHLGIVDKGGGWFYYFHNDEWILLPGCD